LGDIDLSRRQEPQLLQAVTRALRCRIEGADRLDVVAEEIDAYWEVRIGREDIDDAPTPRQLTRFVDQRHQFKAMLQTPGDQLWLLQAIPEPDGTGGALEILRWHDLLHEPLRRRNDDHRALRAVHELSQDCGTLNRGLQIERQLLIGQGIRSGPEQYNMSRQLLGQARSQAVGTVRTGGDYQGGAAFL
jgi:hypothetical protein